MDSLKDLSPQLRLLLDFIKPMIKGVLKDYEVLVLFRRKEEGAKWERKSLNQFFEGGEEG